MTLLHMAGIALAALVVAIVGTAPVWITVLWADREGGE